MTYMTSEDSKQVTHTCSLINTNELLSIWRLAKTDQTAHARSLISLRWTHVSERIFSDDAAPYIVFPLLDVPTGLVLFVLFSPDMVQLRYRSAICVSTEFETK